MRDVRHSGAPTDQPACNSCEEVDVPVDRPIGFVDQMFALADLPHSLLKRNVRMSDVALTGVHTVVVEIGGTPIRLCGESASFVLMAQDRYAGFLNSDSQPMLDLRVDVISRSSSDMEDLRVAHQAGFWSVERGDFSLDWDSERRSGKLQLGLNAYSLDTALRILHTVLLAEQYGFLLHAASAVRGGQAFLFFGPSGSGKTTLSRLAPPDATLLTDEISYVRRHGDQYMAYGTPFTGELAKPGENVSAPVAGLYQLVKARANRLALMNAADAARALLGSVLFFAENPHLVSLVFRSVCDVVCQLPVYQLEFEPHRSVWELVQ
jgi:hypothetical protein